MRFKSFVLCALLTVAQLYVATTPAHAQTEVHCGDIVQGEFVKSDSIVPFTITLQPGTVLSVKAVRFGDYLEFGDSYSGSVITAPSGNVVARGQNEDNKRATVIYQTGVLGERGIYKIGVRNSQATGTFTLYIGCKLPDGQQINPGDTAPQPTAQPGGSLPKGAALPPFSGVGFPGLAPVDFTNAVKLPLPTGGPTNGVVTPTGGEILGFTITGKANDVLDLSFTRASGNLNLGLVVLSADNKVVFQASLVTTKTLSTQFTLPSAGQYTIGVFRIDLLAPDKPEPTAFQIQGKLNP